VLGFGALPHALAGGSAGSVAILVPEGATWTLPAYELALLSARPGREVRVVTAEISALEAFGPGAQAAADSLLDRHGVRVETGRALEPGSDPGDLADTVISLPLLSGPDVTGVEVDPQGYLRVDERLRVVGAEHVHAAGDATDGPFKQGGLAAQQADTAATEIVRSCAGAPPDCAYEPVLRGKLTAPDGEELYLRRALDGSDPGRVSDDPLWQPSGIVCAWRLSRWLAFRRGDLEQYTVDHVARPATVSA
jgi:sulfide:quinone oxidoreductase